MVAVKFDRVFFKYRNNPSFALSSISFDILEGDFVLLAGYSGSGKSTLLKCINGLVPHLYSGSFGGKVTVNGEDTLESEVAHLAKKVGFVFQNPENQLSNLSVEREIAFPLENFGVPREEMRAKIEELIQLLDLESIRNKSPFEISGGEQQLTAIAAALALDPPILVLDEITAHLAPQSAVEILNLLGELNQKHGKTIIISEHRLDRCIHLANKLAFIESGELKVFGETRNALLSKEFPRECLPKIPTIFKQLQEQMGVAEETTGKSPETLTTSKIPLTVQEMVELITGG